MNKITTQPVYKFNDNVSKKEAAFFMPAVQDTLEDAVTSDIRVLLTASGLIVWASQSFSSLCGIQVADLRGLNIRGLLSPLKENAVPVEGIFQGQSVTERFAIYPKQSFPEIVTVRTEPSLDDSGEVVDVMISIDRLVTSRISSVEELANYKSEELRKAEETNTELSSKLKKAYSEIEELKSFNKAKSIFLANMSHEIRTPMNAVIGFCDLLSHTELEGDQEECVDAIHSSGQILLELINQILDYSKVDSGMVELTKEKIDLVDLLEEVRSILVGRARIKGIDLFLDFEGLKHRSFMGDGMRIRQIFMNLVSNAIKFTRKGFVKISLSSEFDENSKLSKITCAVEDTGIGISSENLGSVFEPFIQADQMVTKEFGGTGLGLAISKSLCQSMAGHIEVESTLGRGTAFTFDILLPVVESELKRVSNIGNLEMMGDGASLPSAFNAARRILVVDDNQNNLLITNKLAEHLGYDVETVEDGLKAIEILKKKKFDIVLMDVRMSPIDGLKTSRKIRSSIAGEQNSDIYIIALTANALQGDRDDCLDAGMNDYLAKPLNLKKLSQCLEVAVKSLTGN